MTYPKSVRRELNKEIARQGYTLSSFSKVSGINRGVLSLTLNEQASKSLSMNQLNRMIAALQLPAGWLYERYAQELLSDIENVSWRKIKDLLTHCLQLGKVALIETILDALEDKPIYVNYIFKFAEELHEQGVTAHLSMLYQYVLDHELNLQTERFVVSQYRLFRASLSLDLHQCFRSAIQFAPYRQALPVHLKLDALAQLINVSFALKDWHVLNQYGVELVATAKWVYRMTVVDKMEDIKPYERPLIVYYGKGYIAQCAAWEYLGDYQKSKKLIPYYEDLSWFEGLTATERIYVEKYAIVAKCNRYNLELLQGNHDMLLPYISYLEFFPEEQPASWEIVIRASNLYKWDIDDILAKYHDMIYPPDILAYLEATSDYAAVSEVNRYINIYYHLALYYFERKKSHDQLEHVLSVLKHNIEKYNRIHLFDSTELFEKLYKFYASTTIRTTKRNCDSN
ncbi:hypothetical protein [Paenibacillus campi]|uniref:hypothetical protein n=1 Tax=Paenibacillus campi TaxID=3106031 RepID=UPI002AFF0F4E|nr:hypothetical protein [Paenibacillus sp. SGZ-1014]